MPQSFRIVRNDVADGTSVFVVEKRIADSWVGQFICHSETSAMKAIGESVRSEILDLSIRIKSCLDGRGGDTEELLERTLAVLSMSDSGFELASWVTSERDYFRDRLK